MSEPVLKPQFSVTDQKALTEEVLAKLPFDAIVAGGAARDWYYWTPAQDIDIYFNFEVTPAGLADMLEMVKVLDPSSAVEHRMYTDFSPNYAKAQYLNYVFSFAYQGLRFQFMNVNCNLDEVVAGFPVSCSKIEYKQGNIFKPSSEFLQCNDLKVVLVSKQYEKNHPYVEKIKERFKDKFKLYREM